MALKDLHYEVFVEWGMTDWSASPTFAGTYDDISGDVQTVGWNRGKDSEDGNMPAATFEIRMKSGLVSKYSPFNTSSVLYPNVLPWKVIRVRATFDDSTFYPVFFGYISKYTIVPDLTRQSVTLYCTDGADLLARNLVTLDYETRTGMNDSEAVTSILDAAGWSPDRRNISTTSGLQLQYPNIGEYGGL